MRYLSSSIGVALRSHNFDEDGHKAERNCQGHRPPDSTLHETSEGRDRAKRYCTEPEGQKRPGSSSHGTKDAW